MGYQLSTYATGGVMQGRNHWGVEGGYVYSTPQVHNFRTKQRPTDSVLSMKDIAFYMCSEFIRTRNFTIFNVYNKIIGQFTAVLYFL